MTSSPETLSERYAVLQAAIDAAATKAGRAASDIDLIAVSKRQPDARIEAALAAGLRRFGENRVQEAQGRWETRRDVHDDLHLRLIGPLQSNKSEDAVRLFDAIDVLDRPKLARTLADAIQAVGRSPELMVQVNTGAEPQKSGVSVEGLPEFLEEVRETYGLSPVGLMCIPPENEPAGPHFALLAKLAKRHGLAKLSMGMSGDFETAITFGATHIRVGSALFGPRETPD